MLGQYLALEESSAIAKLAKLDEVVEIHRQQGKLDSVLTLQGLLGFRDAPAETA
jgi:hypothetical protein